MAGTATLDTGQYLTYLFLLLTPFIIQSLLLQVIPQDPLKLKTFVKVFSQAPPHLPQGHIRSTPRKRIKRYKKPVSRIPEGDVCKNGKVKRVLRTYLFSFAMILFQVGCRVEIFLRRLGRRGRFSPRYTALSSNTGPSTDSYLRFDSDSFQIGVDNHASFCMANSPHLFEDLTLVDQGKQVNGIGAGLAIKGTGTFVMRIEDDEGKVHTIKIPNSLYLPNLKSCLLSPQHWAQEAKAMGNKEGWETNRTWMENHWDKCVLLWQGGKFRRSIPHSPLTNTPSFHTAHASKTYRAFAATFEACRATFFQREKVIQHPGVRETVDPAEYIADENIHLRNFNNATKVREDDDTVQTSNKTSDSPPPSYEPSDQAERRGPLTFDPTPPVAENDDPPLYAADDQAELMRWHYRLGHASFSMLKQMAKNGEIPKKLAKVLPPKCAGCLFGATTKIPWRGKESASSHEVFVATKPGECVSVDQMVSTQVGFFAQMKGKLTLHRYRGATIFVDHFSRLRFIHLMRDSSSEETIKAKRAFEQFAADHGVKILHYHCDNGRFADNAFKGSCESARQRLTFCGVNAHFQNGIAERAIRDLSESARKQLLHARARWPAAVHLALWPYALRSAALLFNSLPVLEDGTSRLKKFSLIRVGMNMKHLHTFGCPVFALNNALAAGSSIPKWSPRACIGLNLGPSPMHARNVYLVLNLHTGLVSPQYHCRFDDFFETTRHGAPEVSDTITWQQMAGLGRANEVLSQVSAPILHSPNLGMSPSDSNITLEDAPVTSEENDLNWDIQSDSSEETQETEHSQPEGDAPSTPVTAGTSQRGRVRTMSRRMADSVSQRNFYGNSNMHYMANQSTIGETEEDLFHDSHLELQERMRNPIAFHAEMMGDIMYLHQALRQPDAKEFVTAVVKEINGHVENENWELVPRDTVPEDAQIVPSVWSMRRKRDLTTNDIKSHKARLNLHGGKQIYGMNYFETYAPVVTWFAIRLVVIFGIIFQWALRQVDFIMAYPQAPIEEDIYMEVPQGIDTTKGNSKDMVLKLLKNIYGQKQAGRVWNSYLVEKLASIGFYPSLIDDCVFFRGDVIFMVYVDDGIFVGNDDMQLQAIIKEMQDLGLKIEDQGHPADYVGVNIKKLRNGSYELTQRALIDSIINDVGLSDSKTKPVPAKVSLQLHAFKDQPIFDLNFNYRSAVGKLNYLAQTTRPDIMYATHQIAKYSSDPRVPHGEAILYLVRYLKRTRDLGICFKPDPEKGFECFCDADFSGNWNKQFASVDPSTSKSRSGWVVFYAGCPVCWASKLQSQVALSTTEAEYIAMSQALRDVIPVMNFIQEMNDKGFQVICNLPNVYCKVFEDNSGALELARLPKLRPRTKHINVCYHHFREHVRKGLIKIFPVSTKDQIADVLTKALAQNDFQRHRRWLCGK